MAGAASPWSTRAPPADLGSTSHAPGLVFQTNASKTMTEFASDTVEKLKNIDVDGAWCFNQVGGLEVATTPERLADLHHRQGWGHLLGRRGRGGQPGGLYPAAPAHRRRTHPRGLHVPSDGLAKASRAVIALARRAGARGARFHGSTRVTGIEQAGGRVTGDACSAFGQSGENQGIPADKCGDDVAVVADQLQRLPPYFPCCS